MLTQCQKEKQQEEGQGVRGIKLKVYLGWRGEGGISLKHAGRKELRNKCRQSGPEGQL